MVEPPDLHVPFGSDSERAAELARLLNLCSELERWLNLAAGPIVLSEERRAVLVASLAPGDTPESKLSRWATLFEDELRVVFDSRSRAVHGIRLGDPELRGTTWLADHLLQLIGPATAA
jgi:hypothetical protein